MQRPSGALQRLVRSTVALPSPPPQRWYIFRSTITPRILLDTPDCIVFVKSVNDYSTNQYLVGCKRTGVGGLIDCGDENTYAWSTLASKHGLLIQHILATHAHIDHIMGIIPTKIKYPLAKIYLHSGDRDMFDATLLQGFLYGIPGSDDPPQPDVSLKDGDTITVGTLSFKVLHTPGHCPGHCIFYNPENSIVFSGDLLFRHSIGRTDLQDSSPAAMRSSLHRIMALPDNTRVFPGHSDTTTIGEERIGNIFLRNT